MTQPAPPWMNYGIPKTGGGGGDKSVQQKNASSSPPDAGRLYIEVCSVPATRAMVGRLVVKWQIIITKDSGSNLSRLMKKKN